METKKKKRKLTAEEISQIRTWMETSPLGRKPTPRQIANRYGVTQPSVVKSLGGWKGIERNRPDLSPKPILDRNIINPKLERATLDISGKVVPIKE